MSLNKAPNVALADVEWRVDGKPTQGSNPRCRFVPYVGAATVATLLDEWVGPAGWKDEYQFADLFGKAILWCKLSIRDGEDWIDKRDVGMPSEFEAQKGAVSDAFKRAACLKWGVARNVYSMPTLWGPCRVDNRGKAWPSDQTLPAIHRELKKLGYEATGRLSAGVEAEPDVAGSERASDASTSLNKASSEPKGDTTSSPPTSSEPELSHSPGAAPVQGDLAGGESSTDAGTPRADGSPSRDNLLRLIDEAKEAGLIKWADVARKGSAIFTKHEGRPPGHWGQLEECSTEVLQELVAKLELEKRMVGADAI